MVDADGKFSFWSVCYIVVVSRLALASALSFGTSSGCALFVLCALLMFEGLVEVSLTCLPEGVR